ncbi:hypothetical protein ACIQ9P_04160 [Kitasatospora sp. NPDC094019]|uniref:hypothetical protein n=1 Tax=Kitasatospora sp. NPDC094019 TaxID=3364091 RepID=UPI0037F65E9E
MDTRPLKELPGITAESFRLHGRLQPPPLEVPDRATFGIDFPVHGSLIVPDVEIRYQTQVIEHLDATYDFAMSSDFDDTTDVVYYGAPPLAGSEQSSPSRLVLIEMKSRHWERRESSHPGTFLETLVEAAVSARTATTTPLSSADAGVLQQRAERVRQYSASRFIQRLARLESVVLLRQQLAKDWQQEAPAPPPSFGPEVDPLAVACGITRLAKPIVPGAPPAGTTPRPAGPSPLMLVA